VSVGDVGGVEWRGVVGERGELKMYPGFDSGEQWWVGALPVKAKHCTKGAMEVKAPGLRGGDVLTVTSR